MLIGIFKHKSYAIKINKPNIRVLFRLQSVIWIFPLQNVSFKSAIIIFYMQCIGYYFLFYKSSFNYFGIKNLYL